MEILPHCLYGLFSNTHIRIISLRTFCWTSWSSKAVQYNHNHIWVCFVTHTFQKNPLLPFVFTQVQLAYLLGDVYKWQSKQKVIPVFGEFVKLHSRKQNRAVNANKNKTKKKPYFFPSAIILLHCWPLFRSEAVALVGLKLYDFVAILFITYCESCQPPSEAKGKFPHLWTVKFIITVNIKICLRI